MDEDETPAVVFAMSSDRERKWAPALLLGPVLPAILGLVVVLVGSIVVNVDTIDTSQDVYCGYPLDTFLKYAIVTSYLLLLVFAWTFIGMDVSFTLAGRTRRVLKPFSTLTTVGCCYAVVFIVSFIVWIFGSWAVGADVTGGTCRAKNPVLYTFDLFLVVMYWLGFFFGAVALMRLMCGAKIAEGAQKGLAKAHNFEEVRDKAQSDKAVEQLVQRKFKELDEDGSGSIANEQFEELIESLGLRLSSKKLKKALAELDASGEGRISYDSFLVWYAEASQED